jgi:transposase InsO family protein
MQTFSRRKSMPWKEWSLMLLRREFVELAIQSEANVKQLCDRFGISRKTGYKWMKRYREAKESGLRDRSRRPQHAPERSAVEVEAKVLAVRDANPAWGARKIRTRLEALSGSEVPAGSTIHAILRRHGRVNLNESSKHQPWQRFEREAPNQLWQMDFKGHFALGNGQRCHPLGVVDDHSRFALCLQACHNEQGETVQQQLTVTFRRYGLPEAMLMDNGAPWGSDRDHLHTVLTVWLLRLGVGVRHGRPWHPETQGKQERFHRSLKAEVLAGSVFGDFAKVQTRFDQWRQVYNHERPHQALGMAVPASRYQVSPRAFPEVLPGIEYSPGDIVRKVQDQGRISFHNRDFRVGTAFRGYPVAVRPTLQEGVFTVHFCSHQIAEIQLRDHS